MWYARHGSTRGKRKMTTSTVVLPRKTVMKAIAVLALLVFSKYVYMTSLSSYYTFYMIERFGVSVQHAQVLLFVFLGAVAVGTVAGGPVVDWFGTKFVIWFSILGALPFTLALPYADYTWTVALTFVIGVILASAFSAIVVFAQELVPGRVGMIAGLFFGFAFGIGGIGAAGLGVVADHMGIEFVYRICSYLPLLGLLTIFLPDIGKGRRHRARDV
jgi:FSR family fosmidomycin resistance protein-like MFS transporter